LFSAGADKCRRFDIKSTQKLSSPLREKKQSLVVTSVPDLVCR
jgi:hypothetical protein